MHENKRDQRQADVFVWVKAAFTVEQATSLPQRGLRLLEEAVEAFQSVGGDPGMAHRLVDYVFVRPAGELRQELGGVGIGVLALAAAAGVSADEAERFEVERVLGKPLEHFRRRNAAKNSAGLLALGINDNVNPDDVDSAHADWRSLTLPRISPRRSVARQLGDQTPSEAKAETGKEPADHEIDPVTYTDQVVLTQTIRRWLDENPGKSRWTLTRGQLQGLMSVIDSLSGDG